MTIQQPITLDLALRTPPAVVHAVQNDENTRLIVASLTANGAAFTPPAEATAEFRLAKPDGTFCLYDADENNDPAVVIDGSTVTVTLLAPALQAAGIGKAQIDLYDSVGRLASFTFLLDIEAVTVPDDVISDDYINILTGLVTDAAASAADAEAAQTAAEAAQAAAESAANGTVHFDVAQTLTSGQQTQARSNIDAPSTSDLTTGLAGAVPTSRTVNSKALSSDITLSASDVGAVSSTTTVGTIDFTNCTEVTVGDSHLRKQGNVVMLFISVKPDSSVNNGAFLNSLVTLPTGFRPAKTLIIQSTYPNDKDIRLYLQPGGTCNLYNASGAAIPTTQQLIFGFTFVG